MPVIGFLGTLSAQPTLKYAFQAGLSAGGYATVGWGMKPPATMKPTEVYICAQWANGNYGGLATKAAALFGVPNLQLVAATGGLVSRDAAASAATSARSNIPILFVSGRYQAEENSAPSPNMNGIYLGTTRKSLAKQASQKLLQELLGGTPTIFHLVNPNSVVSDYEQKWKHCVQAAKVGDLTTAFKAALSGGADAMTVSADPYFTSNRKKIIAAAKSVFKKPVCYPFVEYVLEGGLMSIGPNLAPAYCQLGTWAATLLGNANMKAQSLGAAKVTDVIGVNLAAANSFSPALPNLGQVLAKAAVIV